LAQAHAVACAALAIPRQLSMRGCHEQLAM